MHSGGTLDSGGSILLPAINDPHERAVSAELSIGKLIQEKIKRRQEKRRP